MSYKEDVSKSSGLSSLPDFNLVKAAAPHKTYLLNQKGPTVIRIYPAVADNAEVSFRLNDGEGEFSDWIHYEPMVRYYGVLSKATVFLRTLGQPLDYKGPLALTQNSLYQLTHRAGVGAYPPEWKGWFKKDENDRSARGPALGAPDHAGMVQGMLLEHGGKRLVGPDGRTLNPIRPVVLVLNKTARQWLEQACDTLKPGASHEGPFEERYALGDIVHTAAGRLISFSFYPTTSTTTAQYKGTALDQCIPISLPLVLSEWRPWSDVLDFLDEARQIALLTRILPAEALDYALGSHPEFSRMLPSKVRGAFARCMGHSSVAVGSPALAVTQTPSVPYEAAPPQAVPPGNWVPPSGYGVSSAPAPNVMTAPVPVPAPAPMLSFTPMPASPVAGMSSGALPGTGQQFNYAVNLKTAPGAVVAPAAKAVTPPEFKLPDAKAVAVQPTGDVSADAARVRQARAELEEAIRAAGGSM